jgi:hypothetical protein
MIPFAVSVVMVVVGLTLLRRTSHRGTRLWAEERSNLLQANLMLTRHANELRQDKQRLAQKVATLEQNRELDRSVAEDAVKREHRAKEGLRAVLRENHCTPAQIEKVMNAVDGAKIED